MVRTGSLTAIVVIAIGILCGGTTATADPSDAGGPPLHCPSNVCQTAAGPVRMKAGDIARLAVHNHSDEPIFVVIAFIDAATGEPFRDGRSTGKILETGQFTSFDFVSPANASVIGGLRLSYIHAPKRGGVGARFEITDGTSNTIMLSEQVPKPVATGPDWARTSYLWSLPASTWGVDVGPPR